MSKKSKIFESENQLCEDFASAASSRGWLVFPETSNWDLLLVNKDFPFCPEGTQIGVQAKLRSNMKVLVQAMPQYYNTAGPNYHAVLVPDATSRDFRDLATRCRVWIYEATPLSYVHAHEKYNSDDLVAKLVKIPNYYRFEFDEPCWHPEQELWTRPGVKSPRAITPWKVAAVELCILLDKQGYLTSLDFAQKGVDITRWRQLNWLLDTGSKLGRRHKYIRHPEPHTPLPDEANPEIAESLRSTKKTAI